MKKRWGLWLGALLLVAAAGCSASANEGVSSPSAKTASSAQAGPSAQTAETHRIVATTVAVTQMMDALGIELVGVPTSAKTLPARYDGATRVGNPMSPDLEIVKSLKPTEVLSVTTLQYDLEPKFESAGIEAEFVDLTSLASMQEAISTIGGKYGKEEEAKALVAKYDDKIAEVQAAVAGKEQPKVLILMGVPGSYLVATEHSYIGDLVKMAGGVNVVQGETVEYLASNSEYLHQSNPDVILRAAHGMPEEVVKMFDEEFKENDIWKHFNAVKNGRVYDLEEALFGTTGNLAADEALDALVGMLYP